MSTPQSKPKSPRLSTASRIGLAMFAIAAAATVIYASNQPLLENEQVDVPDSQIIFQSVGVMASISSDDSYTPTRYTATVTARRRTELSFQASERVDQMLVDQGDRVVQGQLLAVQDDTAIAAQHNAALAQQKQAAAVLAELRRGPRQETIEVARAELSRVNAQLKLAQTTLQRQQRLNRTSAGSQQELDVAASQFNATQATAAAARQRLRELELGTRQEQIDAQEAAFETAVAAVQQAQARLDQTRLRAPFNGRISHRFIDEGSLPQRGTPAFEIIEVDHLEVRFGVAAGVAKHLELDQTLTFTAAQTKIRGTVARISPTLDRATRTQEIVVDVDTADNKTLVDGQTVRIEFAVPTTEPGVWVPTEALQRQVRGLWSVLVIQATPDEQDAHGLKDIAEVARRDVELLATWGQWSRVRGTLEPNEQVIVSGSSRVSAGQRVQVQMMTMAPPWQDATLRLSHGRTP
jgi:RND family efflux transporter MFP subunit